MADDDSLLLTVPEAARLLRISRNTCYDLVARGEIPAVKLGERLLRIPRVGLTQWIARQAHVAEPPPGVVSFPPQRH